MPTFGQATLGTAANFSGDYTFQPTSDEVIYSMATFMGAQPNEGDPSGFFSHLARTLSGAMNWIRKNPLTAAEGVLATAGIVATAPEDAAVVGGISAAVYVAQLLLRPNAQQTTVPAVPEFYPVIQDTNAKTSAVPSAVANAEAVWGTNLGIPAPNYVDDTMANGMRYACQAYMMAQQFGPDIPGGIFSIEPGTWSTDDYGMMAVWLDDWTSAMSQYTSYASTLDWLNGVFSDYTWYDYGGGFYSGSDKNGYTVDCWFPQWLRDTILYASFTPSSGPPALSLLGTLNQLFPLIPVQYGNK